MGVEHFMHAYFRHAKNVGDLTRILCSALEEEQAKSVAGIGGIVRSIKRRKKKVKGADDFVIINNRIAPVDEEEEREEAIVDA